MIHQSKVSHKKVCGNHSDVEDIRDDDNEVYYLASRKAMNRKHISHRDSKDERSRNTADENPEAIEESIKEAIIAKKRGIGIRRPLPWRKEHTFQIRAKIIIRTE